MLDMGCALKVVVLWVSELIPLHDSAQVAQSSVRAWRVKVSPRPRPNVHCTLASTELTW
jgi:hypothetical protein